MHKFLDYISGKLSLGKLSFGVKSANTVLAGPTSGTAAEPDFRGLVGADIPWSDIKLTTNPVVGKIWQCTNVDGSGAWETAAAGGDILTDGAWAAAGDLIVGSGVDTAVILTKGSEGRILRAGATTLSWELPASQVSDTAYTASWDTVTTIAPSKNAVYDEMELRAPKANPQLTGPNITIAGLSSCILMATDITGYIRNLVLGAGLELNLTTSTLSGVLPTNYISGLTMTHATDADHDITIAPGKSRDSTDAADMVSASAITKQADAAWAAGTNAGGMDTGSIPASGTLHVWQIKSASTGVVDYLFSISATAPTLPANYNYKRLIGSYRTNSSSNIIPGDWWGTSNRRRFILDTPILDVNTASPGTSAVTAALSVPGGVNVIALVVWKGTTYDCRISSLYSADIAPDFYPETTNMGGASNSKDIVSVLTNTSSQIRYRMRVDEPVRIATYEWEQYL